MSRMVLLHMPQASVEFFLPLTKHAEPHTVHSRSNPRFLPQCATATAQGVFSPGAACMARDQDAFVGAWARSYEGWGPWMLKGTKGSSISSSKFWSLTGLHIAKPSKLDGKSRVEVKMTTGGW